MSNLSTITVNYDLFSSLKNSRQITCIKWSPLDQTGLLVANQSRQLFLYDTRYLKSALSTSNYRDLRQHPIGHIDFTPDRQHLITTHCAGCPVDTWKLKSGSKENFLHKQCVVFQNNKLRKEHANIKFQPFVTCKYLYIPDTSPKSKYSIQCYDIISGKVVQKKNILKNGYRNIMPHTVLGYGSRLFDDEGNPVIIYDEHRHIRWSLLSKQIINDNIKQNHFDCDDDWSD